MYEKILKVELATVSIDEIQAIVSMMYGQCFSLPFSNFTNEDYETITNTCRGLLKLIALTKEEIATAINEACKASAGLREVV